jgi:hypothetical protein
MTTRQANGEIIEQDRRTAFTGRKWVRWTARMKANFLDHLAATCNVRDAAAAIGVTPGSLYQLRRRDAAFAEAWREAVVLGYDMLETLLLGHVLSGRDGRTIAGGPHGPIEFDAALRLLAQHGATLSGKPFKGGARIQYATRDETDAAILKKLDALDRAKAQAERARERET